MAWQEREMERGREVWLVRRWLHCALLENLSDDAIA